MTVIKSDFYRYQIGSTPTSISKIAKINSKLAFKHISKILKVFSQSVLQNGETVFFLG